MQKLKADVTSLARENARLKAELKHAADALASAERGRMLREGEQERAAIELRNRLAVSEDNVAALVQKHEMSHSDSQRTILSLSHSLEIAEVGPRCCVWR